LHILKINNIKTIFYTKLTIINHILRNIMYFQSETTNSSEQNYSDGDELNCLNLNYKFFHHTTDIDTSPFKNLLNRISRKIQHINIIIVKLYLYQDNISKYIGDLMMANKYFDNPELFSISMNLKDKANNFVFNTFQSSNIDHWIAKQSLRLKSLRNKNIDTIICDALSYSEFKLKINTNLIEIRKFHSCYFDEIIKDDCKEFINKLINNKKVDSGINNEQNDNEKLDNKINNDDEQIDNEKKIIKDFNNNNLTKLNLVCEIYYYTTTPCDTIISKCHLNRILKNCRCVENVEIRIFDKDDNNKFIVKIMIKNKHSNQIYSVNMFLIGDSPNGKHVLNTVQDECFDNWSSESLSMIIKKALYNYTQVEFDINLSFISFEKKY